MYNEQDAESLRAELAACELVWSHYSMEETQLLEEAKWARNAMTLAQKRIDEIEDILDTADVSFDASVDNKE